MKEPSPQLTPRCPPIQDVINLGLVPRFVELLKDTTRPDLQFEAAWALTSIASGIAEHTRVVVEQGAVPLFVQLLKSTNDDVREHAVWALGNIAGDSIKNRDGARAILFFQVFVSSGERQPAGPEAGGVGFWEWCGGLHAQAGCVLRQPLRLRSSSSAPKPDESRHD